MGHVAYPTQAAALAGVMDHEWGTHGWRAQAVGAPSPVISRRLPLAFPWAVCGCWDMSSLGGIGEPGLWRNSSYGQSEFTVRLMQKACQAMLLMEDYVLF